MSIFHNTDHDKYAPTLEHEIRRQHETKMRWLQEEMQRGALGVGTGGLAGPMTSQLGPSMTSQLGPSMTSQLGPYTNQAVIQQKRPPPDPNTLPAYQMSLKDLLTMFEAKANNGWLEIQALRSDEFWKLGLLRLQRNGLLESDYTDSWVRTKEAL